MSLEKVIEFLEEIKELIPEEKYEEYTEIVRIVFEEENPNELEKLINLDNN